MRSPDEYKWCHDCALHKPNNNMNDCFGKHHCDENYGCEYWEPRDDDKVCDCTFCENERKSNNIE